MTQNIALIDWLSFSLPTAYNWTSRSSHNSVYPVLYDLFGNWYDLEEINSCGESAGLPYSITQGKGNWYREHHVIRSSSGNPLIHVFLAPTAPTNAGTSAFSIPGYALSNKPDALRQLDPGELLRKVQAMEGKLTRADLALDYFGPVPIMQYMKEASRPEVWRDRIITPLRFNKPVPVGWQLETLYYGRLKKKDQKPGTAICAYDKAVQTGTPGPWLRLEIRTGDRDLCKTILEDIISGRSIGELTAGLLLEYLRFVPPGMKTKYNRPTSPWWEDLLTAGAGYELQRHSSGKVDEDSHKQRQPPSEGAFLRYINEALRLDESGIIRKALFQIAAEEHLGKLEFR